MSNDTRPADTGQGSSPADANQAPALDPELLVLLRCPLTRSRLRQEGYELVAEVGGLRYPIHKGIPILLVDEATLPEGIESIAAFREKFHDQIPA